MKTKEMKLQEANDCLRQEEGHGLESFPGKGMNKRINVKV
jgi:hypothetical protein